MAEIRIDDGLVSYTLNGKCEVTFNPTDPAFAERLYTTFDTLDKQQEDYKAQVEKIGNTRKVFDFVKERDAEMRQYIDDLFEQPVSEHIFGNMNVYAIANGLPVWANLLLAIMDEIDVVFTREQKLTHPRISKYTKKYHK